MGQFVEGIHGTWNAFPGEGFEVGLGHAGGIHTNEVFAPGCEILEIAGGFEDDHFGVGDVEAKVGVHNGIVDGLDAVFGEYDFDGACF